LGVDVPARIRTHALVEGEHAGVHLADGRFDTERMLRLLNDSMEAALNDGFTGLRSCGDMSWLLEHPSAHAQAIEYEALLNELFHSTPSEAMCLYARRRLPSSLLARALSTHSSTVVNGVHRRNRFFASPSAAKARSHSNDASSKTREICRRK